MTVYILHNKDDRFNETISVNDQVSLSKDLYLVKSILEDDGPENFLVSFGYTGWSAGQLEKEILISDLILRIDFASSKSASRKLIRGNAVKIDKELITDELFSINALLSDSPKGLVISVGKKKYFRVVTAE